MIEIDLIGLKCPLPVLRAEKALAMAATGQRIVLRCTDPMAAIDIPVMLNRRGDRLESIEKDGTVLIVTIVKAN